MKTEADVINKILEMAKTDPSIRAVIRTNMLPKREYTHSYDFFFVVNDVDKYEKDVFNDCLGKRILLYRGDKDYPEMFPNTKAHLMVFEDGITLTIDVSDKETFLSRFNREQPHENAWIGYTYPEETEKNMFCFISNLRTADDLT